MSNHVCRALIEAQLSAWAKAQNPVIAVAWENVPFQPAAGTLYLRGTLLPAATTSPDLAGALTTWVGVYQIDVMAPINVGPGPAEEVAAQLSAPFPVNQRLTGTGLVLQIATPLSAAHAAQEADRYVVPVSFKYRADSL